MDLNTPLALVERPEGTRSWIAYALALAIGIAVALPILAALYGVGVPVP